jgi:hypothetical protein
MHRVRHGLRLVVAAAFIGLASGAASARVPSLGGVLKAGGIVLAVRQFGDEINKVVNGMLSQRGASHEGATRVVPVLSVGRGVYIGAAQVVGAPEQVRQVRAVGQVESRIGDVDGSILVPTNTSTPGKDFRRIRGVGIGALIDFEI